MGLPILDPILTLHQAFGTAAKAPNAFLRQDVRWDDKPIVWVVCLGLGMSLEGVRMFNLLPQEGTSWVYIFPEALVNPDPHQTLKIHKECVGQILSDLRALPAGVQVSVLSISSGNAFGFYVANHFKTERFISVVTGAGLGSEMLWSLSCIKAAREARRLGYRRGAPYDAVLRGNLPIDNTRHLPAKTQMYLGLADAQIPFWFGLKMYRQVKKSQPEAQLSLFMLGHVGTLYMVGRFFYEKLEPTIYGEGARWQQAQRWLAYTAVRVPLRDAPMLVGGLLLGFNRLARLLKKFGIAA